MMNKVAPIVGVSNFVWFPVMEDSKAILTTDDTKMVSFEDGTVGVTITPNVSESKYYASNALRISQNNNTGDTIAIVVASIDKVSEQKIFGYGKGATGVTIKNTGNEAMPAICAWKTSNSDGSYTLHKVGKVILKPFAMEAKTKGENQEYQEVTLEGVTVPMSYKILRDVADVVPNGQDYSVSIESNDPLCSELEKTWFVSGVAGLV